MKQFAVIGLGRFGASLATTLYRMGHHVLALDISQEKIQRIMDEVTHCVQGDATDEEVIKALGLRNFDTVVVSIGHNMQASILTTVLLKELGVKNIVAKANSAVHGKVLDKVGADRVIYPERDMGSRLAHNLSSANILDYIDISADYSIMEIVVGERLAGRTLGKLNLRAKWGISVMAIKKGDNIQIAPGADDLVYKGDILIAIGKQAALKRFFNE
ncbi:MAG: potassium channel family protein [Christensenellales bacterium]|jgi:trk system potassium uptake protein TrkA